MTTNLRLNIGLNVSSDTFKSLKTTASSIYTLYMYGDIYMHTWARAAISIIKK